MFQQRVLLKPVFFLIVVVISVKCEDTTVSSLATTEPNCPNGEFILNGQCRVCHCRSGFSTCDATVGCTALTPGGEVCQVGYTGFPSCQLGLPTPSEDAIKWRSEEAETVTFFVNAIPSVTLVPSLLYEINCSSLLPVDIVTFQLTINSNLPDGQGKKIFMSSKSYDCQVKLVVGGDESEMGISLAITPCTGWTLPTGNDITVNSAFRKLGGSNKVVIDVGFPAAETDCELDPYFDATYEVSISQVPGTTTFFTKAGISPSNFSDLTDTADFVFTPNTAYSLKLEVYDAGSKLGDDRKVFITPPVTLPPLVVGNVGLLEPKPGLVELTFDLSKISPNTGNIRPDEYWVEYTEYEFGASESLSTKVSKQFTVSGDIATCSLHLSYPGTQLRYSIESKVVVGGNEYKETSSSLTYTTTPCTSGPSPFNIARVNFAKRSIDTAQIKVDFAEPASSCDGDLTYRLLVTANDDPGNWSSCVGLDCSSKYSLHGCTKYNVTVEAKNRFGLSALSNTIEVTTPNKTPSRPLNLRFDTTNNPKVRVYWDPPSGPGCNATEYLVSVSETATGDYLHTDLPITSIPYVFTGEYHNNYTVTVRSVNKVGAGAMSKEIILLPAIKPGAPRGFTLLQTNTTCLNISWIAPTSTGGIIEAYDAVCRAVKVYGRVSVAFHRMTYKMVEDDSRPLHTVMCGLFPGSQYDCSIAARNYAGSHASPSKLIWTFPNKPQALQQPEIFPDKFTATTVTMFLPVADQMDRPVSAYFVGIEKYSGSNKTAVLDTETLTSGDFGEYNPEAPDLKYITAKLTADHVNQDFVVGDDNIYNGFHNAPLTKGQQYTVYYGVQVTRGQITKETFIHSPTPFTVKRGEGVIQRHVVVAIVSSVITMVIFTVVIIILILIRRKRGGFTRQPTLRAELIPLKRRRAINHKRSTSDNGEEPSLDLEPIPVNYLKSYIIANQDAISQQYRALPAGFLAPYTEAIEGVNNDKNRFANILPYDKSRVILPELPGVPHSDYINASYVDGFNKNMQYIAACGPKPNTVADFWRMIYELKSTCIVMVTKCVEEGKIKCEKYWPDNRETEKHGDLEISCTSSESWADFATHTFSISKEGDSKPLICHHFFFLSWPDHGVPRNSTPFLLFRRKVKSFSSSLSSPLVIHCSAGVGRTGTFIAIDYLLDQAETEKQINVFQLVQSMRNQRVSMVQTIDQYHYIYQAVCEALETKEFYYSAPQFQGSYLEWNSEEIIEQQFEALAEISAQVESFDFEVGNEKENKSKNQNPDILPHDQHRAYIISQPPGYSTYINAVFINSYRKKDMFIATQMPLPHTVDDYLRLIFDQQVTTVVSLEPQNKTNEKFGSYLPDGIDTPRETNLFTVGVTKINDSRADIVTSDVSLTYKQARTDSTWNFRHIQANFWHQDDRLPQNEDLIFTLLEQVEKCPQQAAGDSKICVQCRDGNERTGLFLSLYNALDRLKTEQEVDVYHTVELIRMIRPQAVTDTQQYKFIYEMLHTYLQEFDLYANYK